MVTQSEIIELFGTKFRRFLYDNFSSTEMIGQAVTQTGAITTYLGECELSTGVQESSTAKIYYNKPNFNPWYSTLMFKLQFTSISDIFAFAGLKKTTEDPSLNMTESHIGLMINSGTVYLSTGDGFNQQRTKITGFDPTNNIIYRIIENRFSWYPLPIRYPYFDGFRYEKPERKWAVDTTNATYPPENQDHYFIAFIKNNVGLDKILRIKHIVYGERYAD